MRFSLSRERIVTVMGYTMELSKDDTLMASYYAGFFDGEGCAFVREYSDRHGKTRRRLTAKLTQVDREVLDRLVTILGCGSVVTKSDKRAVDRGWKTCHEAVYSDRSAREFLVWIEPYLLVKKNSVSNLLDEFGRNTDHNHRGRVSSRKPSENAVDSD